MEAKLAHHRATPNPRGNHFTRSDMASRTRLVEPDDPKARIERQIQAMLTNARAAGRAMARYAIFLKRGGNIWNTETSIVELLCQPNSMWMTQKWRAGLVHPELRKVAFAYMRKVLREKGWGI